MELFNELYLDALLRVLSAALQVPVVIVLLVLVGYALWCVGSLLVEAVGERRNFREHMPAFLAALSQARQDDVEGLVAQSGLLRRQKAALLALWDLRFAPAEACTAIARRLVADEDGRYRRIFGRNDVAAKIAPMFGLMGTLIPLGPGIVALGQGDTSTLSASLGIAFNTTVAGLIAAAVCFCVARVRRSWYADYMVSLESAMSTLLEMIADLRERGEISIDAPGSALADWGLDAKGRRARSAATAAGEQYVSQDGRGAEAFGADGPAEEDGAMGAAESDKAPKANESSGRAAANEAGRIDVDDAALPPSAGEEVR